MTDAVGELAWPPRERAAPGTLVAAGAAVRADPLDMAPPYAIVQAFTTSGQRSGRELKSDACELGSR